ncbi:Chromosome associated protein G [Carabus blaptoides fortunei]
MSSTIAEILTKVQNSTTNQQTYMQTLKELCEEVGYNQFSIDFLRCLVILFSTDYKTKNVYFERCYDFCIHFVLHMVHIEVQSENLCFIDILLENLLQYLQVKSESIKVHACTFINEILSQHQVPIAENVRENVLHAVLGCLNDSRYAVRLKAIHILQHFQNPQDPTDVVTTVFIQHLCDKEPKIRAEIVGCVYITNESIPILICRCRDIDENVRLSVFKRLANISVKILTIEQRHSALKNGLNDRSQNVKNSVSHKLLPAWLNLYDNDYLTMLKALQLDATDEDIKNTISISEMVLNSLFSSQPIREILEVMHLEDKLMPMEQLTWEVALYWNSLVRHIRSKNLDEYLDKIIPETILFCKYIEKFCSSSPLLVGSVWEQTHHYLILHQLVCLLVDCDISDQASRLYLNQLVVTVLKESQLTEDTIKVIVKYFVKMIPNTNARMDYMCEIISDIRNPLTSQFSQLAINEDSLKEKKLKDELGNLTQQLNKAVQDKDFTTAEKLKHRIESVKNEIAILTRKTNVEENVCKKDDPETITKYLKVIELMLQSSNVNKMNTSVRALKDALFKEMTLIKDVNLRAKYLKCFALLCCIEENSARENIQFFCLPLILYKSKNYCDQSIVLTAVAAVTDFILLYGVNVLVHAESVVSLDSSADFEEMFSNAVTLTDLIEILSSMMDDKDQALREISSEAIVKLLVSNRIQSAMLLSRLILKWFNPNTANDVRLSQILGTFLESLNINSHFIRQLEDAFVPTLQAICLAPVTSPLADVSKINVLKFLVQITDSQSNGNNIHNKIALVLCNEILKDIDAKINTVYVKALLMLNIAEDDDDSTYIEELLNLCEDIRIDSRDKYVLANIIRFINYLKE